jgi:intraflagellar transport protein 81
MLTGNKNLLLSILVFLLSDVDTFKKRCYLYQFLHSSDIPPDLEQDEGNLFKLTQDIIALNQSVKDLQAQFTETHKFMESVRPTGI